MFANTSLFLIISLSDSGFVNFPIFCGKWTTKIEPLPNCDCTLILPFIISIKLFVIARPKPLPSVVVFFSISNLSNLLNNLLINSAFIPLPVSLTVIMSSEILFLFIHFISTKISPCSVYLMALVNKLFITSFTWTLSPISS